jgi:hypothetical protein
MKNNKEAGLIKMIILIVIAIAILSWYGVDIKEFIMSEQFQKNWGYVINFIKDIWSDYLAAPAHYLWGIWVTYLWDPFMNMLKVEDHTGVLTP